MRLVRISLAVKYRILFGLAVLLIIGAALFVPFYRMEQLLLANIRMATLNKPLAVFTFTGENLGATKTSEEEAARRRGATSPMTTLIKAAATISHRWRKLLAGAYKFRDVKIDIYTLDSPTLRQNRQGRVGFSWPNR